MLKNVSIIILELLEPFFTLLVSDDDECLAGTHQCDETANCTNTNGSYTCECDIGYTGNGYICNCEYQYW